MTRAARAQARGVMQKRLAKRKGCIPRLRNDCGRSSCGSRPTFVRNYSIVSGKYNPTDRGQYCRSKRKRNSEA